MAMRTFRSPSPNWRHEAKRRRAPKRPTVPPSRKPVLREASGKPLMGWMRDQAAFNVRSLVVLSALIEGGEVEEGDLNRLADLATSILTRRSDLIHAYYGVQDDD